MYKVIGDFFCQGNNLTSLEGCPKIVEGTFNCGHNNLTSLEGCPEIVKGSFWCENQKNGHKFTVEEVRNHCKVGRKIYV